MTRSSRLNLTLALALIGVLSAGLLGCTTSTSPTDVELENLSRISLDDEFTPDREVVISYVELPPDTTMRRHWHPGEEFHYYLEGHVEIAIDGLPSIDGTPGTTGHVPYKKTHTAITGTEGAKLLVFRVHSKGEPVRYFEEGGSAEQ